MIPVSAIALMLFVPRSSLTFFGFDGGALLFMLILVSVLAAPLVIVVSLHLHHTNPFVSIIHTGVGTILFAFANQMFRDYFARLNGEDFTPPL